MSWGKSDQKRETAIDRRYGPPIHTSTIRGRLFLQRIFPTFTERWLACLRGAVMVQLGECPCVRYSTDWYVPSLKSVPLRSLLRLRRLQPQHADQHAWGRLFDWQLHRPITNSPACIWRQQSVSQPKELGAENLPKLKLHMYFFKMCAYIYEAKCLLICDLKWL